jgi:hypothetical protein
MRLRGYSYHKRVWRILKAWNGKGMLVIGAAEGTYFRESFSKWNLTKRLLKTSVKKLQMFIVKSTASYSDCDVPASRRKNYEET